MNSIINNSSKALLVIDVQKDYFSEKRKPMFSYNTKECLSSINAAIKEYSRNGYRIIYIGQVFPDLITNRWFIGFSIKGTEGAELADGLDVVSDLYFEKNLPDAFTSKQFRKFVSENKIEEFDICGIDLCGCAGATALGAAKSGYRAGIVRNSTFSRFPDVKQSRMMVKLANAGVKFI